MAVNKITKEILGNFYAAVINEPDVNKAVTALTDASSGSQIIDDEQAKILQGFYGITDDPPSYERLCAAVKNQHPQFNDGSGGTTNEFDASKEEHIYQMLQAIPNSLDVSVFGDEIKDKLKSKVEAVFVGILNPANDQDQIESLVKLGLWRTILDENSNESDKKAEISKYFNEQLKNDLLVVSSATVTTQIYDSINSILAIDDLNNLIEGFKLQLS